MDREADVEKILYRRPAGLAGTEVWSASGVSRRWHVFHETYTFSTCIAGFASWRYRGSSYTLRHASNALIEPGETHVNTTVYQPGDFWVALVSPATIEGLAQECGLTSRPHFRPAQVDDPMVYRLFARFYLSVEADASVLEQQSRFVACMNFLFGHCTERTAALHAECKANNATARAQAYLHDRFNEAVSLGELAAEAGLSRFHLLRAFSQRFGMPPHAYQIHLRIARARALLQAGMLSSLVAGEVGFSDQSHFTRHFKNIIGTTPRAYAEATAFSPRFDHCGGRP